MADARERILLEYDVDRGALNRVVQSSAQASASVRQVVEPVGALGPRASASFERARAGLASLADASRRARVDAGALASSWQDVERAVREAAQAAQQSTVATDEALREFRQFQREGRLQRFALRSLGGVLPGGGGEAFQQFTGAFELLDTLPKLDLSFRTIASSIVSNILSLNPLVLAGGAAIAGLTLAIGEFNRQAERVAAETRARLEREADLARFFAGATRETTEARVAELREQLRQEEAALAVIAEARARAVPPLEQLGGELGSIASVTGGLISTFVIVAGRLNELNAEAGATNDVYNEQLARVNALREQILELNTGLLENRTAANDAEQAERALAEARRAQAEAAAAEAARALQAEFAVRRQLAEFRERADAQQLEQRRRSIELELRANDALIQQLRPLADQSDEAARSVEALTERQRLLQLELDLLAQAVEPVVRAREAERRAAEELQRAIDRTTQAKLRQARAEEARQQQLNALYDQALRAGELAARARAGIAEATQRVQAVESEGARRRAAIAAETARALEEAEQAAAQRRADIIREGAERVARIEEGFARDRGDAIANRDALAFLQARRRRDDALRDEARAREEQLRRLDEQLRQQNDAARRRGEERLAEEAQRSDAELALRRAALAQAQVDLQNALRAELAIREQINQAILNQTRTLYGNLVAATRSAPALGAAARPAQLPSPPPPARAIGGRAGGSLTINVQGATTRSVRAISRRQALDVFGGVLDAVLAN